MSIVNKRLGREKELRKKLAQAKERFESVYKKKLSPELIEMYANHCEKQNFLVFMQDRLGRLSDVDAKYIRDLLAQAENESGGELNIPHDDIPEGDEDFVDEDDLGKASDFIDA